MSYSKRGPKLGGTVEELSGEIVEALQPTIVAMVSKVVAQLAASGAIPEPSPETGGTFKELADAWWRVESGRLVEPKNEARHIRHLEAIWGLTESTLTPKTAREALLQLLKPKGKLGANTVNKVHATARRIIREAQINGEWGASNPFALVPRLKGTKPDHVKVSIAEARAFLPHLRDDRRRMALAMLFLGPRPGELIALQKPEVDLLRGEITFRRSRSRDATKTGAIRRVPIPDELLPELRAAMELSPSEYVFCGQDGGKMRDDTKLARCLQDAFRRAGLVTSYRYVCCGKGCGHKEVKAVAEPTRCPRDGRKLLVYGEPRRVRFYDLRHSCAWLLREAGCDARVIQIVLGHAPRNTTDGFYGHVSDEFIRLELNKLSLYKPQPK